MWYNQKMNKTLLSAVAVLAVAFFVSACQPSTPATSNTSETEQTEIMASPEPTPTTDVSATSPDLESAPEGGSVVSTTATYQSPAGPEEVGFSLVLNADGTIVEGTTTILAKSPISKMRQESFSKDFSAAVAGKKLTDLGAIDRVGGSSLTTGAFNQALQDLQAQI